MSLEYSAKVQLSHEGAAGDFNKNFACSRSRVKGPYTVHEDNDRESDQIVCFVTEFAEQLLRLAKHREWMTAVELIDLFNTSFFDIKSFKQFFRILVNCEEVATKCTNYRIKHDGSNMITVSHGTTRSDHHSTL